MDYGGVFGALLTDLSKAFVCIPYDLTTAKLEAYGFQTDALNLIYDYLSNRKQILWPFLAPKIWDVLPKDKKGSESLDIFKRKIKN